MWCNNSSVWGQGSVVCFSKLVSVSKFGLMMSESEFVVLWSSVVSETSILGLPFISMVAEVSVFMSIAMRDAVVNGVGIIVCSIERWSMKSELVVLNCHVMIWLAVKIVLWCVMVVSESMSIKAISLLLWLHSLLAIGHVILLFSSESGLVVVWGQLVMSVWLVKVLLVMMNWAVLWHVWVVVVHMVFLMMVNVMRWSIFVVMRVLGVMVISMAPMGSVVVDFGVVWGFMMRSLM